MNFSRKNNVCFLGELAHQALVGQAADIWLRLERTPNIDTGWLERVDTAERVYNEVVEGNYSHLGKCAPDVPMVADWVSVQPSSLSAEEEPLLPEPVVHVEHVLPDIDQVWPFLDLVSELFTDAPKFDFVRFPDIDLCYQVAWAAGRGRGRGRRGRKPKARGRGVSTGLERQMLDYLRITAPAVAPSLRDVAFPLSRKEQVVTIRRGYDAGTVTTANGAPAAGVIAPTLSLLPDFTDFTNLFDAYRFECVRVTFTPVQNNVLSEASRLYTVIDYDDANALATASSAQEYSTVMVSTVDNTSAVTRSFRPKFATAAYSGVFTSFAQSSRNQWIDVASTTVPNYGLKWIIDPDNAIKIVYRIDVLVCVKLKCVR